MRPQGRPQKAVRKDNRISFRVTKEKKELIDDLSRIYNCDCEKLLFQGIENLKRNGGYHMTLEEIELKKNELLAEWKFRHESELTNSDNPEELINSHIKYLDDKFTDIVKAAKNYLK